MVFNNRGKPDLRCEIPESMNRILALPAIFRQYFPHERFQFQMAFALADSTFDFRRPLFSFLVDFFLAAAAAGKSSRFRGMP